MKLYIKQRIFSLVDSFDVFNENGHPKYTVKNQFLSLLHHLTVYDGFGNAVGNVDQRFALFLPTFDISINGSPMGSVSRAFSFFVPQYNVSYQGWDCEGDLFGYNYEVHDGLRTVATIHKKFFAMSDSYEINIADEKDELMVLMLVMAIDATNCSGNNGD